MRFTVRIFCILALAVASASSGAAQALPASGSNFATPQGPGPSGVGVILLDIPAVTQDDPRARSYVVDRLAPGTTIARRIKVTNNSDSARTVYLYAGAARVESESFVAEANPSVNELTTWISVDKPKIELPPKVSSNVLVTIDVSKDASEGEQYGVVWAETRSAPIAGSHIAQASRAGVRIYLSVGAGNGRAPDFAIDSISAARDAEGNPQVIANVTNTGGRTVDILGKVTLADGPGGLSAGPFTLQKVPTLAPGQKGTVAVTLPSEVPKGPWHATLSLSSGLVQHEASATITFPAAGQGETVKPERSNLVLWIALGVTALTLLLAAALIWRRRTIKFGSHRPPKPAPVQAGDGPALVLPTQRGRPAAGNPDAAEAGIDPVVVGQPVPSVPMQRPPHDPAWVPEPESRPTRVVEGSETESAPRRGRHSTLPGTGPRANTDAEATAVE